ncbi:N-6 DNA methylase [Chlorobium limicola DSM 245]|uniref:site-specific DNA-methyltransferase (adenine-specific) n=1 Tax=Chlorobium limicola (strain DSM 245 / NBRC 103803 / 6330) TaxID=290315 RepID=B3EIH7_CHLL2|nr:class I SAM-dependent DNA methyltransferase [Chlorobium limicola]ACD91489.1 N-6 DNA methylase [Chlorobium limicola DSM 245]
MHWIAPSEKDTATAALEKRLWDAADQLRANSGLKAQEYSAPVLGLIFLLFADVRFAARRAELESAKSSTRRGSRVDDPAAYHAEGVLYLSPEARFGYLLNRPEAENIGVMVNEAMRDIEKHNQQLAGVLPKTYYLFDSPLLKQLLKKVSEIPASMDYDAFGRIYEYFLGEFAMSEGQGGGEFYTPVSIVRLLTEVIEPYHGRILDPACGSGGMFVSSARFVAQQKAKTRLTPPSSPALLPEVEGGEEYAPSSTRSLPKVEGGLSVGHDVTQYSGDPNRELSIHGIEKTDETGRLCRLNLAVHGLEGRIMHGGNVNSYYDDPHEATGNFDFVLANPPFNVNAVDKERLKDSVGPGRRFPFGLPRTDNANYLWIQLFYSALNERGRAGFVMANSASDARSSEQEIRRQLVEIRAVDVMVAVGPNMFYTVTLPCTLWFFDKAKAKARLTPPSSPSLLPEVEGGEEYALSSTRLLPKIEGGEEESLSSTRLLPKVEGGEEDSPLSRRILTERDGEGNVPNRADTVLFIDARYIYRQVDRAHRDWTPAQIGFMANLVRLWRGETLDYTLGGEEAREKIEEVFAVKSPEPAGLNGQGVHAAHALAAESPAQYGATDEQSFQPPSPSGRRAGDEGAAKHEGAGNIAYRDEAKEHPSPYGRRAGDEGAVKHEGAGNIAYRDEAKALPSPSGRRVGDEGARNIAYRDIPGLCKAATLKEIEAQGWSLNPGRYVGVAAGEAVSDEDFKAQLETLNEELELLNAQARELEATIAANVTQILES